jgi:multidrug resistance protein
MDFMIMMPMAPQLMRVMKINPQQFSILVASYTISAGIASFLGTFFVDKFDRKKVVMVCYAGFTIGTFICGLAINYHFLLIARVLTGLLGGIIGSQVLSIVGDIIPTENRGKATGIVMTGFSAASVLGVPVGLLLATKFGWEMPFFAIAAVGVLVFIAGLKILPPLTKHLQNQEPKRSPIKLLSEILSYPKHRMALIFTILVAFSHFTMIPFLSPYMVANVGFEEIQLSYIYMFGGALTLFTGPFIGKLADKYGVVKVFTILACISFIPQLAITNMPAVSIWIALFFTSLFFIFSGGRFVPSQALTIGAVQPAFRGGFMSLNSAVMQLASGLAAFLAGLVVIKNDAGQLMHYEIIGYSTLIFSTLTIFMAKKLKS